MSKWQNIRVDFAADMKDHPDLVTGQCPFCKRFHTTIYFYGLPMEKEHFCPHCEQEVTMVWDVETYGYHAYCPFCRQRLMLCDMCQHPNGEEQATGDCDYDSKTDTCRFSRKAEVRE